MSKFRVGDLVRVRTHGSGVGSDMIGTEVTIVEVGTYSYGVGYKVHPPIGNTLRGFCGGMIGESTFELVRPVYPNPPHKHADLIKAWADGAAIEYLSDHGKWSSKPSGRQPSWYLNDTYRIKPAVDVEAAKAKEIAAVRKEMEGLATRLKQLEK